MDILRQNLLNYSIFKTCTQTSYSTNERNYYMLAVSYRFNSIGKRKKEEVRKERLPDSFKI